MLCCEWCESNLEKTKRSSSVFRTRKDRKGHNMWMDEQQMDDWMEILIHADTKSNWQVADGWRKEAGLLEKVQGDWPVRLVLWIYFGNFIIVTDECRTQRHFGRPDELRALQLLEGQRHLSICEGVCSVVYLFIYIVLCLYEGLMWLFYTF